MNVGWKYILCVGYAISLCCLEDIVPYKFTDQEINSNQLDYQIPLSARFTINRLGEYHSDIVYYLSKPQKQNYPIAICCTGSSSRDSVYSVIHFHRYFLQEFLDLGVAVVTVEQQGVDGNNVDMQEFWDHYTRSNRLSDHEQLIDYLKQNPPAGWNGKIILLGVSEGGPIVLSLTEKYADILIATINWSGFGDWSWRDELWVFIEGVKKQGPWWLSCLAYVPSWVSCVPYIPKNRSDYDLCMDRALKNPTSQQDFMGMSLMYHADALRYPAVNYEQIKTPLLVVAGALDTIIDSADAFVMKAQAADVHLTYFRVEDMDHYIRRRPDIVEKSFVWLEQYLK